MLGVRVQPWALRYFLVALVSLVAALALMAAGLTFPTVSLFAPTTLVAVHLVTIGWLSILMLGALHQFVPVITTHQLHSDRAPVLTLALLVLGLSGMIVGFLSLPGGVSPYGLGRAALALPLGGATVVAGVAVAIYNLGLTLWQARPLPLAARYVATSLGFLGLTVLMGTALAMGLAAPSLLPAALLAPIVGRGLPLHLLSGVAGWFTLTAMGVGVKLLSMFTLAPEDRGRLGEAAWLCTAGGIAAAWLSGLGYVLSGTPSLALVRDAGWLAAAAGAALFLVDMALLYRARRRRALELNAVFGAWALGALALGLGAWALAFARGVGLEAYPPIVFIALFGWLSGLGLSQLYKIVPFLTWIERYGRRMGRERVPLVQDLVDEPRARPFFVAYFVAVAVMAGALAVQAPLLFRAVACSAMLAVLAIGRELLLSRRGPRRRRLPGAAPAEGLGERALVARP